MLATISGFASISSWDTVSTIAQIAAPARRKTPRDTRFKPATSTMLGIMTMSRSPTYGATLPLATVDTITFGMPSGRARITAVAIAVPPLPPSDNTPAMRPSAASRDISAGAARVMPSTITPRSACARRSPRFTPPSAATVSASTSTAHCGSPRPPTFTISTSCPRSRM
jgi:hypothetical protein